MDNGTISSPALDDDDARASSFYIEIIFFYNHDAVIIYIIHSYISMSLLFSFCRAKKFSALDCFDFIYYFT